MASWRNAAFSLLGVYAVATVAFLALGGASPEASMDTMEAQIVADANSDANGNTATGITDLAGSCDEIDPRVAPDADPTVAAGSQAVHQITFNTLDGEPTALSAYAGCPLIINFFASWCVPCVTEMPEFDRFWTLHGSQVAVVGLAVEAVEPARAIVEETGVTYLVGLDESDLFIELGGLGMPTTVFVSSSGELLDSHSGILTFDDLQIRAADHFDLDDYFAANAAAGAQ